MWSLSHTQCYPHAPQQSLEDKMVERVRNVIKHDRKRMPSSASSPSEATKRSKLSPEARKKDSLLRRYPTRAQFTEDASSIESLICYNFWARKGEATGFCSPPPNEVYISQPSSVLNDATSGKHILNEYPALRRQVVVRNGLFCHVWLIS